ncbi:RRM domain-containing protein [Pseudoscourfieldia marina]
MNMNMNMNMNVLFPRRLLQGMIRGSGFGSTINVGGLLTSSMGSTLQGMSPGFGIYQAPATSHVAPFCSTSTAHSLRFAPFAAHFSFSSSSSSSSSSPPTSSSTSPSSSNGGGGGGGSAKTNSGGSPNVDVDARSVRLSAVHLFASGKFSLNISNVPDSASASDIKNFLSLAWDYPQGSSSAHHSTQFGGVEKPPFMIKVAMNDLNVTPVFLERTKRAGFFEAWVKFELPPADVLTKEIEEWADAASVDDVEVDDVQGNVLRSHPTQVATVRGEMIDWLARRVYESCQSESSDVPVSLRSMVLSASPTNNPVRVSDKDKRKFESRMPRMTRRIHHIAKSVAYESARAVPEDSEVDSGVPFSSMPVPFSGFPRSTRMRPTLNPLYKAVCASYGVGPTCAHDKIENMPFVLVNHVPLPSWNLPPSETSKEKSSTKLLPLYAFALKHVVHWCASRGFDPLVPFVDVAQATGELRKDVRLATQHGYLSNSDTDDNWKQAATLSTISTSEFYDADRNLATPEWCNLRVNKRAHDAGEREWLPKSLKSRMTFYNNRRFFRINQATWDRTQREVPADQGDGRRTCTVMLPFASRIEAQAVARELHGTVMGTERLDVSCINT